MLFSQELENLSITACNPCKDHECWTIKTSLQFTVLKSTGQIIHCSSNVGHKFYDSKKGAEFFKTMERRNRAAPLNGGRKVYLPNVSGA